MILRKISNYLLGLNRQYKTIIIIATDYILLTLSFWLSLSISKNSIYLPSLEGNLLILITPIFAIPIYYLFGLYKSIIRYSNIKSLLTIIKAVSIYTLLWFFVVLSVGVIDKPYDFLIINWLVVTFLTGAIRYIAQGFFSKSSFGKNVVIFGAGVAGIQLEAALRYDPNYQVIAFIDKKEELLGKLISGKEVSSPLKLDKIIEKKLIDEILVAIPSISKEEKIELFRNLKKHSVIIKSIPRLSDLTEGKVSISDLKKIDIEDLLRRTKRSPSEKLLKKNIEGKNVLITGAGGSIGSEIARQVVRQKPKSLVLYEISEYSLYSIDMELTAYSNELEIISLLGDIEDTEFLNKVIRDNDIDTIYHTAAYKHVPLIEKNIISAVKCNILGTLSCLSAAIQNNVNSFVYISTDKAVRPTSVMGATKRFAEILIQARVNEELSKQLQSSTKASIVRFGNVLGSSGSVVPLFRDQIASGGPVTVTDPEIIRYFMTITEASELVIQAGTLGKNAEIFILDMGEQVNVADLAKDMIMLSGKSVRDKNNPEGDIEIIFTGLRPGEKLFEELLINDESFPTQHEKIMIANEKFLDWEKIQHYLEIISSAVNTHDIKTIHSILNETVEGFHHKLN